MINTHSAAVDMHSACQSWRGLDFAFTMAFQPIVDLGTKQIFGHEALVRGLHNEPADAILSQVTEANKYQFDQMCRNQALKLAAQLQLSSYLSINLMPNAVYPAEASIRATLDMVKQYDFPIGRVIFEVTEGEQIHHRRYLFDVLHEYQRLGFLIAIDDFGAGHAGLGLLADFQPNILKIDMSLIRCVHVDRVRQAIVRSIVRLCEELQCEVIAEGIESREELLALHDCGISLFQGYYFARPVFQGLAELSAQSFEP